MNAMWQVLWICLILYDNVNNIDRNEEFQIYEYIPKVHRTEV